MLLSTDKSFVPVLSAPSNYSPNVALLLQYLQPDQEANVDAVITYLIECLEDEGPFKKRQSLILLFCSAIFKGLREFQNPNTFQCCLTHVKHALKGAALVKFRKNTSSAKRDAEWAEKFLHCNHCAMQQLQFWKRAARRNIVLVKVEKIRWTADPGIVGLDPYLICIPQSEWKDETLRNKLTFQFNISDAVLCWLCLQCCCFVLRETTFLQRNCKFMYHNDFLWHFWLSFHGT